MCSRVRFILFDILAIATECCMLRYREVISICGE
jgi:hypothetical protein